jgi:hypothetical protein
MGATARTLASEILRAFTDRQRPPAESLSQTPGNDDGTAGFFADKSWQDLTAAHLMEHRSALSFFTPSALAYFLPAFLKAAVETGDVDLVDAVVSTVTPPKNNPKRPSYWRWWTLLTPSQQRVVIECLRHWDSLEHGNLESAADALEATVAA